MKDEQLPLCPAAELRRDATIIGIIQPGGEVSFIGQAVPAVAEFCIEAHKRGRAEHHFRFAATCLYEGCDKWRGDTCSVANALRKTASRNGDIRTRGTPQCGIESQCQWRALSGTSVCKACRFVASDAREPAKVHFSAPQPAAKRKQQAA